MKDANGFHVDISDTVTKQDSMLIRMNVDDFEAAYDILEKHGFVNSHGDKTFEKKSGKAVTMTAPSGFRIALVKHIKDHD